METKTFTQKGSLLLFIFIPTILFLAILAIITELTGPLVYIISFVTILLLACTLTFYKLTITVTPEAISFSMGIGLFKKRYLLSEIKSCKPLKNPLIYGIGIRLIPNGVLYNVAGTHAVELQFKNRKSVVRIGTNQPNEVCNEIQKHLEPNLESEELIGKQKRSINYYLFILIIVAAAVIVPVVLIAYGSRDTEATIESDFLKISGMYGTNIALDNISKIDTLEQLPSIQMRTNGYAAGNSKIGHFKLANGRHVILFIKTASPPFIQIITNDSSYIYLNFSNPVQTRTLYSNLVSSH